MSSADGLEAVTVQKLFSDVFAPAVASPSWGRTEAALTFFGRVGPHQIAQGSVVRDVLNAIDLSDLIEGIKFWGESSVQAEKLIFDFRCDWKTLKEVCEHFPNEVVPVFLEAFIIEPVKFVDLTVLVVASEEGDAGGVLDFEQEDVEPGLYAVETAVHIVAHEEVVCVLSKGGGTGSLPQI
jgi:hypothetical protein